MMLLVLLVLLLLLLLWLKLVMSSSTVHTRHCQRHGHRYID